MQNILQATYGKTHYSTVISLQLNLKTNFYFYIKKIIIKHRIDRVQELTREAACLVLKLRLTKMFWGPWAYSRGAAPSTKGCPRAPASCYSARQFFEVSHFILKIHMNFAFSSIILILKCVIPKFLFPPSFLNYCTVSSDFLEKSMFKKNTQVLWSRAVNAHPTYMWHHVSLPWVLLTHRQETGAHSGVCPSRMEGAIFLWISNPSQRSSSKRSLAGGPGSLRLRVWRTY